MIDIDRTRDTELLRQVAKIQDAELRRLQIENIVLRRENAALKGASPEEIEAKIAEFEKQLTESYEKTRLGGSERRPRNDKPEKPKRAQKGHGPTPQPKLAIEHVEHDLDEADKVCPTCGGGLEPFDGQFAESEEVDVVGVQYVLKKHRRKKYRCPCGCSVQTADAPKRLVPGGRYSIEFAIRCVYDKFDGHLPYERQVRRMARAGLKTSTQTLWDQSLAVAGCFKDAIQRLHAYLLKQDLLLADESRWPLLGALGRKSKNWYAWTLVCDNAILHKIQDSRSNEAAAELLRNFKGVLVTDGYVVYTSKAKELGYVQAHCWSHARRKFLDAESSEPELAGHFLDDMGELFGVEREIDECVAELSPVEAAELRAQVRDERSRAIVNRIGQRAAQARVLPRSPIAAAIKYLENRWDGLVRFVDDARVPTTSNAAERALRGLVLGRNNHFGSRSQRGTEVAAIFYSLIESAKLNGLNPVDYLRIGVQAHLNGQQVPLPHEVAAATT